MVKLKLWHLTSTLLAIKNGILQTDPSIQSTLNTKLESKAKGIEKNKHVRVKVASSIAKSERRQNERLSSVHARSLCTRCKRPTSICLCHCLPPHEKIKTNCKVLILQHPSEFRRKTISTVPLISLVLENCKVCVGYKFDDNDLKKIDIFQDAITRGEKPLLLFPGPDSLDLANLYPKRSMDISAQREINFEQITNSVKMKERNMTTPSQQSNLLILLDGTWSQARRMARDSPSLIESCQKVQFTAPGNSIYDKIRKEPEIHFLSTLECCVHALLHLEPLHASSSLNKTVTSSANEAAKYLTNALEGLVNQQLEIRNSPYSSPRYVDPKNKYNEKHEKRRLEIEQNIFQTQTHDYYKKTVYNNTNYDSYVNPSRIMRLPDGSTLRPLRHSDAPSVNNQFDRKTSKSLSQITRCIHANPACFGIFRGHELCAFILQYENGVLGMLHVEGKYRRKGYATLLVHEATELLEKEGRECVAYIMDGNEISEKVFAKQGWIKADPTVRKGTGRRRAPRKWIKLS